MTDFGERFRTGEYYFMEVPLEDDISLYLYAGKDANKVYFRSFVGHYNNPYRNLFTVVKFFEDECDDGRRHRYMNRLSEMEHIEGKVRRTVFHRIIQEMFLGASE